VVLRAEKIAADAETASFGERWPCPIAPAVAARRQPIYDLKTGDQST
jgi:hypothetical protein